MKKQPTNALYLLIQLFILLFPDMFRRSKTPSTIWQLLKHNKNPPNRYSNSGVYSIKCSSCNRFYIGQTGREISTRYKEHIRSIRTNNPKSAFALHMLDNNHQYSPIEESLQLIVPCKKGNRLNLLENLYIQLFHNLDLLMTEQNTFEYNPLFSLLLTHASHNTYIQRLLT
jgi:hypothetical protein